MKKFTVYCLQFTEYARRIFGFQLPTANCLPHRQSRFRGQLPTDKRGFTLIEVIVSTALFTIVILVAVGALLALASANRKAQALHLVMNNLNIALDSMVRSIRMGSNYHCGINGNLTETQNCSEGASVFAFESFNGDPTDEDDQWVYFYDPNTKRIYRSEKSGGGRLPITASSVTIDSLRFYVVGTSRRGIVQPKVVIEIKGTAGAGNVKTKATFHIQSTAVQRVLDL